jgi:hypothetical protein
MAGGGLTDQFNPDQRYQAMKRPLLAAAILLSGAVAVIPWQTEAHRSLARPSAAESPAHAVAPALPVSLNDAMAAIRTRVEPLDRAPASFTEADWYACNDSSRFRSYFAPGGVQLVSANPKSPWRWTQRVTGYGYGNKLAPPQASDPVVAANRLDYPRGNGLTEWFLNDSRGLEHGFTVRTAPAQEEAPGARGLLTVTMALETGLTPRLNAAADSLAFTTADGKTQLHYAGLKSWDATGRVLPSRIEPRENGEWALLVDDAGAQYPVTIDPLIYVQTEVTAPDGNPGDEFGAAVAISGNTAVVGAQVAAVDLEIPGAAYVFVRDGLGGWSFQAKLVAEDPLAVLFGFAVDIDGDTVVVGSVYDNNEKAVAYGAAYVYTRTGTAWTKAAKLTASDGVQGDYLGYDVGISGDTIVAGTDRVAVYVYVKPATGWATGTESAILLPIAADLRGFGKAVAIDGNTVIVGNEDADAGATSFAGAVHVFEKPAGGWAGTLNESAILTATGGSTSDDFGTSLDISGDTVIVGSDRVEVDDLEWAGAAYLFVRDHDDVWYQEDMVVSSSPTAYSNFGESVGISGDTAIVGETGNGGNQCSAHVFTRSEGAWSQQAELFPPVLVGTPFTGFSDYGIAVGVDGQLLVIGAPEVYINGQNQAGRAYLNEPDSDGDGIPDGSDVDLIEDAISGLPLSAFKNSASGNQNAFLSNLESIESAIANGNLNTACLKLHSLRTRVDGCGNAADNNDWITDCAAQTVVREYLDELSANLGCP